MIGKLRAVIVDACILAMSNAEEEDRHGKLNQSAKWAAVGPWNAQKRVEWIPGGRKDQLRVFTGPCPLPGI